MHINKLVIFNMKKNLRVFIKSQVQYEPQGR